MNYNRAALKQAAKQAIRETRPKVWIVTLIYLLLASFLPMVVTNLIPNPMSDLAGVLAQNPNLAETHPEYVLQLAASSLGGGALITFFVSVVVSLYSTVMSYGYVGYSLKVHRGEPTGYGDVFSGFAVAGKAIGASIMVGIFTFLWSLLFVLPYAILLVFSVFISDALPALAIILLIAAILILVAGVVWVSCRYALTPYYIMDRPETGVFDAITASKTTMRGNIGKYVVLNLSFLGWGLLIALIMWVILFVGILIAFAGSAAALEAEMFQNPVNLLAMGGTMILFVILAFAASLPLNLWLTGYTNVAYAAFYDFVSGEGAEQQPADYVPYTYGGVPPLPPAPPVPPVEPPVPPTPPVPPVEPPVAPSVPDAPAEPVEPPTPDETPAEPVVPPVEPPVPPAPPAEPPVPPVEPLLPDAAEPPVPPEG